MSAIALVADPSQRWSDALPRPRAFVLSGGASLGSMQVGMLRALGEVQIAPDLLVGTSVGALNAAVTAHTGRRAGPGAARLDRATGDVPTGDDRRLSTVGRRERRERAAASGAGGGSALDGGPRRRGRLPPRRATAGLPDGMILAVTTAMRQRVMVEAPLVAEAVPLAYLPRPCTRNRSLLDLDHSAELIAPAYEFAAAFLAEGAVPSRGWMAGGPHHHEP